MKAYVETSLLLAMAKEASSFDELYTVELVVSDLVIAEVHNLEEPWRQWVAQFLNEREVACLRVEKEDLEFARKYIYNKVLSTEEYPLGVHYLMACTRGADRCYTCDVMLEQLKEGMDRINGHFGKPTVSISVIPCEDYPRQDLLKVRAMVGRLCESQGEVRLLSAIRESVDFFQREKGIRLRRVPKV